MGCAKNAKSAGSRGVIMKFKNTVNIFVIFIIVFSLFSLSSCNKTDTEKKDKLLVVTTLFPLYDFAKAVSGNTAEIILLTQPGVDSHSFEPKSSDMIKVSECNLFIYTGENMELWAKKLISSVKSESTVICDTSKGITLEHTHNDKESTQHLHNVDPHIWTSPKNAKIMVRNICEAFSKADKNNEEIYQKNTDEYLKELDKLDNDFEDTFSKHIDKTFVFTSRFPFLYLSKDYNIKYISAFESCSLETEPDIKSMTTLIDTINRENIKTVFYTELSDTKITDAVKSQTGVKSSLFHSCHNVTKEEFERGETYLSLMRNNIKALEGLK